MESLDAVDDVIIRDNAAQIAGPVAARGDRKLHGEPDALRDALLFTPYADADRQDESRTQTLSYGTDPHSAPTVQLAVVPAAFNCSHCCFAGALRHRPDDIALIRSLCNSSWKWLSASVAFLFRRFFLLLRSLLLMRRMIGQDFQRFRHGHLAPVQERAQQRPALLDQVALVFADDLRRSRKLDRS